MKKYKIVGKMVAGLLLLGIFTSSFAADLQVAKFVPSQAQPQIKQVMVRFKTDAVAFGDAQQPDPFVLRCGGNPQLEKNPIVVKQPAATVNGNGYWLNSKEWLFDFDKKLPADVACVVLPNPKFVGLNGAKPNSQLRYTLFTKTTRLQDIQPYTAEEKQVFYVQFSNPVDEQSLLAKTVCKLSNVGEEIPVQLVSDAEKQQLIKQYKNYSNAGYFMRCARTLSPNSSGEIVVKSGLRSAALGTVTDDKQSSYFEVRPEFSAEINCTRLTANRPCLPSTPIVVNFSALIKLSDAEQISISLADGTKIKPKITEDETVDLVGKQQYKVSSVSFTVPKLDKQQLTINLPSNITDASGRSLANQQNFPKQIVTDELPAFLKFATGEFGILESKAIDNQPALLPVAVRKIGLNTAQETELTKQTQLKILTLEKDEDIIAWWNLLKRYNGDYKRNLKQVFNDFSFTPASKERLTQLATDPEYNEKYIKPSQFSILELQQPVTDLHWPRTDNDQLLTNIGVPLGSGFHIVESVSPRLDVLADEGQTKQAVYQHTTTLVTNLAVHFKHGANDAAVWVTALNTGKPVEGAKVQISTNKGRVLVTEVTDSNGLVSIGKLEKLTWDERPYFISARANKELGFVWSNWKDGIEPWRFSVRSGSQYSDEDVVHTVLDRQLFRVGETVSMKHFLRQTNLTKLDFSDSKIQQAVVEHQGSGQKYPIQLQNLANGNYASSFTLPNNARLGWYEVRLKNGEYFHTTARFRVEAFRLPFYTGALRLLNHEKIIRATELTGQLQLNYVNGGAAVDLPVQISAQIQPSWLYFSKYQDYSFNDKHDTKTVSLLDKFPVKLNQQGMANFKLNQIKWDNSAQDVQLRATYPDPSGEVQTLSETVRLWHSNLVVGIKNPYWAEAKKELPISIVVLNSAGKEQAGVQVKVLGSNKKTWTVRQRLVGGLYSYQHDSEQQDLGELCSGKTDQDGKFNCKIKPKAVGDVKFTVQVTDKHGNLSSVTSTSWVSDDDYGDWYEVEDTNRIDLIADKNSYKPGDEASFQVKMPFRNATAWVSIERDGILEQKIVELSAKNPYIKLKIAEDWTPNVTVTALVLRGRVYAATWRSFFNWGWRSPIQWFKEWWGGTSAEYQPATDMVDLSKPSFRMGAVGVLVDSGDKQLKVQVTPEHNKYQVRENAKVDIQVTTVDGKPAPATVAIAVVDKALLELKANTSWDLYRAMYRLRQWSVDTNTAQMQVVGRRHFGVKAVADVGGGGGEVKEQGEKNRELFDTLLLWLPNVKLNSEGKAQIQVPINDSLTSFKIVAIADYKADYFGTGQADFVTGQDLQIISGLPPVVREGDQLRASFTIRNNTDKAMQIKLSAKVQSQPASKSQLAEQEVQIKPQSAQTVWWDVNVPQASGLAKTTNLKWQLNAIDKQSGAKDQISIEQKTEQALPLQVTQALFMQLNQQNMHQLNLPVKQSAKAVVGRGGLKLSFAPKVGQGLDALQDWYRNYPYSCMEQQAGRFVVMRDTQSWQKLMQDLPSYTASNKLLQYFPVSSNYDYGSIFLTTYILNLAHEMQQLNPDFAMPKEYLSPLLQRLEDFVDGRLKLDLGDGYWLNKARLFAVESLARYGKANAKMLTQLAIKPDVMDISNWLSLAAATKYIKDIPPEQLAKVNDQLHALISYKGSKIFFSGNDEQFWRYMGSDDLNTAKLLLLTMNMPDWQDEIPRMLTGFIAQQSQDSVWSGTTANTFGSIVLEKFSQRFEKEEVTGSVKVLYAGKQQQFDWSKYSQPITDKRQVGVPTMQANASSDTTVNQLFMPHPSSIVKAALALQASHVGTGNPWLTVQNLSAIRIDKPVSNGISISKKIIPVQQAEKDKYTKGDIIRVSLTINSNTSMSWVAINDPIPTGATVLGSGLGRDDSSVTKGEKSEGYAWTAFIERDFTAYRHYYAWLPSGKVVVEYSLRLNNEGKFSLPATRIEALYAPEIFAEVPNSTVLIGPAK